MVTGCAQREVGEVERPRGALTASLLLVTPDEEVIEVGQSEKIPILIDREGYTGPVNLSIGPLPDGVEVVKSPPA